MDCILKLIYPKKTSSKINRHWIIETNLFTIHLGCGNQKNFDRHTQVVTKNLSIATKSFPSPHPHFFPFFIFPPPKGSVAIFYDLVIKRWGY
jgi:hypothetical protein